MGVKFPHASLGENPSICQSSWTDVAPEKDSDRQYPGAGRVDFLGYPFERGMKWPRQKSLAKLKEALRAKTRRTEGRGLKAICEDFNGTARLV